MELVDPVEKVVIFGSTGQLGSDLVNVLQNSSSFDVLPLTHEMADCSDAVAVRRAIFRYRPQFVINCAAYVRVDDCEENTADAFAINSIGALNIARACAEIDACCVYISTDYVFDGKKKTPYFESDPTYPINVYGTSKLAGELLVRQAANRWLIVRTASLFGKTGARGKNGNFVETVIAKAKSGEALKVVNDITISPTYTRDAAVAIESCLQNGTQGVIHVVNRGSCTWFELAYAAIQNCGLVADLNQATSSEFSTPARRPKYSVLGSERTAHLACEMPMWTRALQVYLAEKGYSQPQCLN